MTYSQGTNSYNFAFDYISKYYVKVRINNNEELTYGTHYTVEDKTVALNSVVTLSEGDLIEIFRETPTGKTVEWYDSSILRAQDLNLFNVQLMHINEENMDKLLDSGMQEDKLDSKWDARLKPIKNLTNPTEDDEAINYGFLKSTQNGYLQASQAKVDEATSKAREAVIQANIAYAQAENAKQNATNAYNEANRAYSEAERAKGYADKAKTSEDNVSTMKASVEATKTEVDNIKKAVEATKTDSVNAIKNAQEVATADVDSHKASAVTVLDGYKTEVASYRDATATSATNAANSATNASTKASQASTSATNAANSATNAANSATEAANSAAEAKTYKDQAKAIVGGDFLTKLDASQTYATITDMNTKIGFQSGSVIFDANGTSVDQITVGDNPINYKGNGYKYLFKDGKGNYADIYADEYYGTFRGKAMVGGITSTKDLNNNYPDTYSKKLEVTEIGTANNLPYKWNFITTYKNNVDIAQLAIPTSSNARISLRCLPHPPSNTPLVGDWLEIAYLRDIQPIAAAEVAKIVNSAPTTLDTLNELANALGNDPNFATTVSTQIGQKANKKDVDSQIQDVNTKLSQAVTTLQNGVVSSVEGKKGEVSLWDVLHRYGENYVPPDTSNRGWNGLGVCIIYYTQFVIKNQPTQFGQLINLPASKVKNNESMQIWISQSDGRMYIRGGNPSTSVNDTMFKRVDRDDNNTVNVMYPVGIIVEFAADVDPNSVWEGTTWERMSSGRVLVSAGQYSESDYSHNYTLGETGGEATHQLTIDEMPSHNHHGWTENNGQHSHTYYSITQGKDLNAGAGGDNYWDTNTTSSEGNHNHEFTTDWRGGNWSHNNIQPYEVVNRWKRTA